MTRVVPILLLPLVAACDIPTAPFSWETQWVIPAATVTVGIEDVLPAITRAPSGAAFQVAVAEFSAGVSLAEACQTCVAFHGTTVAKPEFEFTLGGLAEFPVTVQRVRLGVVTLPVVVTNSLNFDPLRPSATARGRLVATAVDADGHALEGAVVSGETTALPPGGSVNFQVSIAGLDARGPIHVQVRIESPAGDPVQIDVNGRLELRVGPATLTAIEADVRIQGESFESPAFPFVPGDVDSAITDRIQAAVVRFVVHNPLRLSGPVEIEISHPGGVIRRPVQLGSDQTRVTIEIERIVIRQLLQSPTAQLIVRGTLSAPGGIATVRPDHVVGFTPEILLTLLMEF
jgi:hypothetical protein